VFSVKVDFTDLELDCERAKIELSGTNIARTMRAIAADWATYEKKNHRYVNRTGNAQRSTRARTTADARDYVSIDLIAGADYASFLNARGFSQIDTAGIYAAKGIQNALENMAARIAL
jgi:hypothetical protein